MDLNLPYYVGKGVRERAHDLTRNYHTDCVTKYLANNGIRRDIRIIARFATHEAAIEFEMERISFWWDLKDQGILTNQTKGGEGALGYRHSPEQIQKMSDAKKGDRNPNKRPEARVRVSIQMSGSKRSAEAIEKTAQKLRGRTRPEISGPKNGMFGKKCRLLNHTEETKQKLRGPRGPEANLKRWGRYTEEERAEHGKAISAGKQRKTPEERRASALKAWETRRKNKEGA
jgi:hypothetical protein